MFSSRLSQNPHGNFGMIKDNSRPYSPSHPDVVLAQREKNRKASRMLVHIERVMELRIKRHVEILAFTKEFLEKPNKGWRGRLLYSILWKATEKLSS